MTFGRFGFGFGFCGGRGAAVSYDPAATALFARMTTQPDATRKGVINTLILALKAAGVWSKFDALYILAAHTAQAARLNWVQDNFNLLAVNGPTFTTDRGYTGDGSSSYLNTQFNPSTAGGLFTQNSAHLSLYDRASRATNSTVQMGAVAAGNNTQIATLNSNSAFLNVNDVSASFIANANSSGHFVASRTGATTTLPYRNGASIGTNTDGSIAPINLSIFILGRNVAGSLAAGSTDPTGGASIGSGLTGQNISDFYTAQQAYMTSVGANV